MNWGIVEFGYEPKTDYWDTFTLAEIVGTHLVEFEYEHIFYQAKKDYVKLTELVMVLNWKIWQHYEKNDELARLYNDLWMKTDAYACENLKNEELTYFFKTTD